ncbi:hypothetical protein G7Y79_00021g050560 [Physcia stellaris]|nr:hypothetical protein G7Y79_00021g050560 [Physcia stellaris]
MAENFIAEAFALLAIGLIVIGLRLYSRCLSVGFRRLAPDDFLMIVAGCLYSAETVAAYVVGAYWKGLANNSMTAEQRAALNPTSEEWRLRVKGSQNQLFGWLVYTVLLWTLKTCMLIFFSRLTEGVRAMRIRIQIGAVLLAVSFLATFLSILFGCYPIEKHWQINPDPGNRCQPAVSRLQVAVLITLNISTDFYLMSVPLPMIWKSSLVTRKKWVLSVMFSGGLLIMVFGLLRCILILKFSTTQSGVNGAEQAGRWSIRESFVAVIVNNLPMLYTLFQLLTRRDPAKNSASNPSYRLGSYRTGESGKKSKKFRHPLSMPNDTAMGSDERIILPNGNGNGNRNANANGIKSEVVGGDEGAKGEGRGDKSVKEGGGITVQTELSVQSTQEEGRREQVGHYGFPERRLYNQYNV